MAVPGDAVAQRAQDLVVLPAADAGLDVGRDVGDPDDADPLVVVDVAAAQIRVGALGLGQRVALLARRVAGAAEQHVVDEVAAALQARGLGGDGIVADGTHVSSVTADDAQRREQPKLSRDPRHASVEN